MKVLSEALGIPRLSSPLFIILLSLPFDPIIYKLMVLDMGQKIHL